jgi:hypothetical protein
MKAVSIEMEVYRLAVLRMRCCKKIKNTPSEVG